MVNFDQSIYTFNENQGQSSGISVVLTNPIAQALTVEVFAGIVYQAKYTNRQFTN